MRPVVTSDRPTGCPTARPPGTWMMHQRFTPYGTLLARDSAGSSMPRGFHVGWTGREYDAETGFSFHRARYYSAELRRWTQEDPIGYAGGANLYAYVGGAVMEARDPSGLIEDLSGRGLGFAEAERRATAPPGRRAACIARTHTRPQPMLDTSPEAAEIQLRALRSLAPRDRLELAVDMSLTARALLRARLQAAHPDWSAPELTRELLLLLHPGIVLPPRPAPVIARPRRGRSNPAACARSPLVPSPLRTTFRVARPRSASKR